MTNSPSLPGQRGGRGGPGTRGVRTEMRTVTKDQTKSYSETNTTMYWIYWSPEEHGNRTSQPLVAGDSLRRGKADLTIGRGYEGIPE